MNISPKSIPRAPTSHHRTFGTPSSRTYGAGPQPPTPIAPIPFKIPQSQPVADLAASSSSGRMHPFAAIGFPSQQGRKFGDPHAPIPDPAGRETPLPQRILRQHHSLQASVAREGGADGRTGGRPKFHFGLSYQKPSVKDDDAMYQRVD
ncbi:hypothetical protein FVEG_14068 [Fusarium verticillioides 7600]|uniref:Uncharacterized protein n=1 Tax=Gibberella moniliformis (strain M3125 / FGSC 7600) TaxID=334819 RepID=W7MXZ5_GIBM7|nr:hypothetical protein FVEG_14068 [Fusarium verticillioides 7600]EWG55963.1 hypothetical protein FVEG_14068 [Fusarium verticillioides 7600]